MTKEEVEAKYFKENKYTKEMPAYLREYPKFWKLMVMISNYILEFGEQLDKIISTMTLDKATGYVLGMIAKRLNIEIETPLNEDGTVNKELYEKQLKIAVLGNGLKRTSTATRHSLSQIPKIFTSIQRCEITDFSNFDGNETPMEVQIGIQGEATIWSIEMLEKYVLPNITGIGPVLQYILYNNNYFGFDVHNIVHLLGTVNYKTENITPYNLNARAKELGYDEDKLELGLALTDLDNNKWVYISKSRGWENRGEDIADRDPIVDEDRGYGIQGFDKGKWVTVTVVK